MTETRTITLANRGGATYRVEARRPLLDTLREQGVDLPYGCKYGGCITCAAKLTAGEVDQRRQVALNNRQINNGYVLLCVARASPTAPSRSASKATTNSTATHSSIRWSRTSSRRISRRPRPQAAKRQGINTKGGLNHAR